MPIDQDERTQGDEDQEWHHPYDDREPGMSRPSKRDDLEDLYNADDAEYPDGHPSKKAEVKDLEDAFNAPSASYTDRNPSNRTPEQQSLDNLDLYHADDKKGFSNIRQAVRLFKLDSKAKKGVAGGAAGLILFLGTMGIVSFLSIYQLEHFAKLFEQVLDARSNRILSRRAAAHYKIIFDEDGKGLYKKGKVGSWLERKYSGVDPNKVVDFMRQNGSDIYVDRKGQVVLNGEPLKGKLSSQRAEVKREFDRIFDKKSSRFMMRDKRFTGLLKTVGIQRTFFENTTRKVDNWQLRMIEKIRERQLRSGVDPRIGRASEDTEPVDEDTQRAVNELDISDEVAAEREALADPANRGTIVDSSVVDDLLRDVDPQRLASTAVSSTVSAKNLAGAIQVDQIGQTACYAKNYTSAVRNGAQALRYIDLMKWGMTVAVAYSQLKDGKDVTAAQVSAFMSLINAPLIKPDGTRVRQGHDIGASGAYQMLVGKKGVTPTNVEQFAVDLSKTGGAAGALGRIDNWADNILDAMSKLPGVSVKAYCKISSGWKWQIISGGVGLVVGFFTGGTSILSNLVVQSAKSVVFSLLGEFLKPILIRQFAGVVINGWEPGDQKMDATITGYTIKAQANNKLIGGHRLTKAQVAQIETQIAVERREKLQNASVYDRYFSLSEIDSTSARIASSLANGTASGNVAVTNTLASLPSSLLGKLAAYNPLTVRAQAAGETTTSNEWFITNPMGITQYGLTDAELDEFDPEQNANLIDTQHKQAYDDWISFCFPVDDGLKAVGMYTDDNEEYEYEQKCENNDELTRRFRIYRLDRQLATGIAFITGQSECMDPDSQDENCAYESSADAPTQTIDSANMAAVNGWAWPAEKIYAGPCYGGPRQHAGLDINVRSTNIAAQAAHDGVVVKVAFNSGAAGNYLTVKVSDTLYYSYEHLRSISVREGQTVTVGQQLGVIGKTGNTIGVRFGHLHMVVSKTGTLGSYGNLTNTMNPLDYLPKDAPNGYACTPT